MRAGNNLRRSVPLTTTALGAMLLAILAGMLIDCSRLRQLRISAHEKHEALVERFYCSQDSRLKENASWSPFGQKNWNQKHHSRLVSEFICAFLTKKRVGSDLYLERYGAAILRSLGCESKDDFWREYNVAYPFVGVGIPEESQLGGFNRYLDDCHAIYLRGRTKRRQVQ